MKKARVAIGAVSAGGILACLLSWPSNLKKCPEISTTILNPKNTRTIPNQKSVPTIYPPQADEEQVWLALEIKQSYSIK
ncbi:MULTISPECIES: hypothetical protein [unclassified Chitinophaga]|uniref:hypothetical protein n=1 Tax=unclassified Chitinophaga TaxID=2619133 RepID=UPI00300FE49B